MNSFIKRGFAAAPVTIGSSSLGGLSAAPSAAAGIGASTRLDITVQ